jgi:prepilin-type N-terminal cleavage/methylation domain-containing protein
VHKRRGFTLTELLVVIGIAVVIMSMGAMAFRDSLRNRKLKNAAGTLQAAILNVRAMAVTMRHTYYGFLDRATQAFGVYDSATGYTSGTPQLKVIWFPEGVEIQVPDETENEQDCQITFRPDGTIYWPWNSGDDKDWDETQAGDADIELREREAGGKEARFDLVANTGWPRMDEIK